MSDLNVSNSAVVAKAQTAASYPQFVHWVAKHKKNGRGSATKMASRLWKLAHAKPRRSASRRRRGSKKGSRRA